jgi:D-alanyl-D-alanine carboxypeptidase
MRGNERFRIGSVTKTFVAALVLLLAEADALDLDQPVAHWLGASLPNAKEITVRHLLTHTSGLAEYVDDPRVPLVRFDDAPLSPTQLIEIVASHAPASRPGEHFAYSNSNFITRGYLDPQDPREVRDAEEHLRGAPCS